MNLSSCLSGHDLQASHRTAAARSRNREIEKTPDVERESSSTKKLLNPAEKQHIPPCFPPRLSFTQCSRANTDADVLNWSQRDVAALCSSWKHRNLTCIFSCCIRGQEVDLIHLTAWGRRVDKRKMNWLWKCWQAVRVLFSRDRELHLACLPTFYSCGPQLHLSIIHTFLSCVWKMLLLERKY